MTTERQLPVEEMIAYEKFTDRVEILRELDLWVKNIQRLTSPSQTMDQRLYWLCECKYTRRKMGLAQIKKLEAAQEAFQQERVEAGLPETETQLWLVSTGGFTNEFLSYVQNRADIYFTDYEGINQIFRAYGGNYTIPLFEQNLST